MGDLNKDRLSSMARAAALLQWTGRQHRRHRNMPIIINSLKKFAVQGSVVRQQELERIWT